MFQCNRFVLIRFSRQTQNNMRTSDTLLSTGSREEDPAKTTPAGIDTTSQTLQVCGIFGQLFQIVAQGSLPTRTEGAQHD